MIVDPVVVALVGGFLGLQFLMAAARFGVEALRRGAEVVVSGGE